MSTSGSSAPLQAAALAVTCGGRRIRPQKRLWQVLQTLLFLDKIHPAKAAFIGWLKPTTAQL